MRTGLCAGEEEALAENVYITGYLLPFIITNSAYIFQEIHSVTLKNT